jgi:DNA-binding transcriptional regulator WhiA
MARGKKSKGKHYVSKGERSSSIKTRTNNPGDRIINQLKAYYQGKNVMVTVENPNKSETNKRFIRVPASTVWKNTKNEKFVIR